MNIRFLLSWFVAIFLIAGCTTPSRIAFDPTQCPADKALVYVYWAGSGTSADRLAIDVNNEHKALLHAHGYYPLFLDPGSVELGYSAQINPVYPIRMGKANALTITLNAGQIYYVSYQTWKSWKPKLVQMDDQTGQKEIVGCTLGKAWQ